MCGIVLYGYPAPISYHKCACPTTPRDQTQWDRSSAPEQPAPLYSQGFWPSGVYGDLSTVTQGLNSSQRTALSPSPHLHSYMGESRPLSRTSSTYPGQYGSEDGVMSGASLSGSSESASTPTIAHPRSASAASLVPPIHNQAFKSEVNDDEHYGFVMEPFTSSGDGVHFSSLPMEVPLRATQASKDMRKMMNVFRLNPFAVNNEGKRGASCSSDSSSGSSSSQSSPRKPKARPLEEQPLMFEFQIQLERPDLLFSDCEDAYSSSDDGGGQIDSPPTTPLSQFVDVDDSTDDLHSFPPEFRLHKEDDWVNQAFPPDGTTSLYPWDGDRDTDSNRGGRRSAASKHSVASAVSHSYTRRSGRGPYQQEQAEYPQPTPSPPHVSVYQQMPTRFPQQHGASDYYDHQPPPLRMDAYLEGGPAPTAMQHAPLPHRTVSMNNSMLYTHEPMTPTMTRHGHSEMSHDGSFDPGGLGPTHRRWSMPETTASLLGSSMHGHGHGHGGNIMVPSLPVQPFLIH